VSKFVPAAVSPSGARVAIGAGDTVLVLDTATGRIARKYHEEGAGDLSLYWLGGDGTVGSAPELLLGVGFSCFSLGCGNEYTVIGSESSVGFDGYPEMEAPLKGGLVFAFKPAFVHGYGNDDIEIELTRMPRDAPFDVVSDVARDRAFAISSGGLVAEIQPLFDVTRRPRTRYHRVDLNGRTFEAAWAGGGKIALWGEDGLGTIDTRTWKTRSVARDVTDAVATPLGLAAWNKNSADGLTVYRPDGKARFRGLVGKRVSIAFAVGDYLYPDADNARYSIDLRTGQVVGPLRRARIIVPDLVSIP
jgi:hypothetical protein